MAENPPSFDEKYLLEMQGRAQRAGISWSLDEIRDLKKKPLAELDDQQREILWGMMPDKYPGFKRFGLGEKSIEEMKKVEAMIEGAGIQPGDIFQYARSAYFLTAEEKAQGIKFHWSEPRVFVAVDNGRLMVLRTEYEQGWRDAKAAGQRLLEDFLRSGTDKKYGGEDASSVLEVKKVVE